MKRFSKIFGLSLGVAAVFGLASCSNEVGEPNNTPADKNDDVALSLVKAPDFYAWSGDQVLADTRSTKGYAEDETGHTYYYCNEEVEINLSVLDKHQDANGEAKYELGDLIAKLSVHVRTETDVKVTMPMFADYVINSDDLLIFNSHDDLLENLAENEHEYKVKVANKDVVLKVTFSPEKVEIPTESEPNVYANDEQPNAVTVEITGVNENVLDYCFAENGDGLNFEVYIYLQNANTNANRTAFMNALDGSSVEFTETPNYYINAFGFEYVNGEKKSTVNPNDRKVEPVDGVFSSYKTDQAHTNGTSFNTIYYNLSEDKIDHKHGGNYDPNDEVVTNPAPAPGPDGGNGGGDGGQD